MLASSNFIGIFLLIIIIDVVIVKKKEGMFWQVMRFIAMIDQICNALKRLELTLNESENKSQA